MATIVTRFRNKILGPIWGAINACVSVCGGCIEAACGPIGEDAGPEVLAQVFAATPVTCDDLYYPYCPEDMLPEVPPFVYATSVISVTKEAGFRYFLTSTSDTSLAPIGIAVTNLVLNGVGIASSRFSFVPEESSTDGCQVWPSLPFCLSPLMCGEDFRTGGGAFGDFCGPASGCYDVTSIIKNGDNTFQQYTTGKRNIVICLQTFLECGGCCGNHLPNPPQPETLQSARRLEIYGNSEIYLWKVEASVVPDNLCLCQPCCLPDGSCEIKDPGKCFTEHGRPNNVVSCDDESCGHPCCISSEDDISGECKMTVTEDDCTVLGGIWHEDLENCCDLTNCASCGCIQLNTEFGWQFVGVAPTTCCTCQQVISDGVPVSSIKFDITWSGLTFPCNHAENNGDCSYGPNTIGTSRKRTYDSIDCTGAANTDETTDITIFFIWASGVLFVTISNSDQGDIYSGSFDFFEPCGDCTLDQPISVDCPVDPCHASNGLKLSGTIKINQCSETS